MFPILGWASTCNAAGQTAGTLLVTLLLVSLTSPTLPRTLKNYFGISIGLQELPRPVNGTAIVLSRKQFMYISYKYFYISCGALFLLSTTLLFFIRERPNETPGSPEGSGESGATGSQTLSNKQANTSDPSSKGPSIQGPPSQDRSTPEALQDRSTPEALQIVCSKSALYGTSNRALVDLEGCESPPSTDTCTDISGSEEEIPLTVKGTYTMMYHIIKMRPILTYIILLFVISVSSHPNIFTFLLSIVHILYSHDTLVAIWYDTISRHQIGIPLCLRIPKKYFTYSSMYANACDMN